MLSTATDRKPHAAEHLDFKPLAPTFCSRFIYHAYDFEEAVCEVNENRAVVTYSTIDPTATNNRSYMNYVYFAGLKKWRILFEKDSNGNIIFGSRL
ncbi:hypothetical protein F5Y10DRAFT_228680 [Nemania abortiva]|nr:hypothetical protein F5Y10DRAFT_228680 [Nemania abortiva]